MDCMQMNRQPCKLAEAFTPNKKLKEGEKRVQAFHLKKTFSLFLTLQLSETRNSLCVTH